MIWSDKMRSYLLRFQGSSYTGNRRNSQEYMITSLEFQIFPPLVMITLLPTLRSLHPLTDQLNLLGSFSNNLRSKYYTLARFMPTQRSPTSPTIQRFKRCHTDTRMVTIIVCELYQWKISIPRTSLLKNTRSQQVLQRLNRSLRLTIGLRMIRRTQPQLRAQRLLQTLPKI